MTWEHFHHHTDEIIDYYTPLITRAMSQVIAPEVLRQVVDRAYSGVSKATQPNLPPAQAAAVTAATTAATAAGAAGAAAGAAAGVAGASVGLAAALSMLATAPLKIAALFGVLRLLYGAGYSQGAHEAASAADGSTPPWMATLPDHGGEWSPQADEQTVHQATGGLSELLDGLGIWIKEMTTTEVDRVGVAVRQSVENGRPLSEAISAVDAIVSDSARARLIAETEYARAMGRAAMDTYRLNNVPMLEWIDHPGACAQCVENAAASPQPTTRPVWPNGPIPVHPHERCSIAPAYPPRGHA